ncbi:MAG: hypothetical protein KIT31_06960 [Deltaproteobacteria bacterium]|nr:hypothetical protein [Deltaproteobacteria bacterium]
MRLGDVGYLENNIFHYRTHLRDLGIGVEARKDGSAEREAQFDYATKGAVDVSADVDAQGADAEIRLGFLRESAVYLRLRRCFVRQLEGLDGIGAQILAWSKVGKWDRDDVVVTEVVEADDATILVSGGHGASATLRLGSDASAKTSISGSFALRSLGEHGLTPLFKARGVKRRLLLGKVFRGTGQEEPPDEWGEVRYP